MQEEIAKQKIKLDTVTKVGDWLMDDNKDNPQFIGNVKNKLSKVGQPLDEMLTILSERKTRLQEALLRAQEFRLNVKNVTTELDQLDKKLDKQKPVSVDWKTLRKQDEEHKDFESNVDTLKPIYEKFSEMGKKVVKETEPSPERDNLKKQIIEIGNRWDNINHKSEMRRKKIDNLSNPSKGYFDKDNSFVAWVDNAEKKLADLEDVPVTPEEVEKFAKDVEVRIYIKTLPFPKLATCFYPAYCAGS